MPDERNCRPLTEVPTAPEIAEINNAEKMVGKTNVIRRLAFQTNCLQMKVEQLQRERDEAKTLAEDLANHRICVEHGWSGNSRKYGYWAHRAGSLEHSAGPAETAMGAIEMLLAAEAKDK